MIQTFGFEEALRLLKRGYKLRRASWPVGESVVLRDLQWLARASRRLIDDHLLADLPSELLAEDWCLA